MYQFTNDLLIGIETIDNEHKKFFSIINDAFSLLQTENINIHTLARETLARLLEYARTHFAHEEEYMKEIQDPELTSQKQEHTDFINRIKNISFDNLGDYEARQKLEELLKYLSGWLFKHIISSDTLIGKFESPFAFTSKYHTGIELVDEEHRHLFEIIANADKIIHADLLHDKYDEIVHILSELKEYTIVHFQDEEEYMKQISYPELAQQQKAHEAFIEKLASIDLDSLDDHQQDYLEDLISFLLNWLTVHILQMDKKIGEYTQ